MKREYRTVREVRHMLFDERDQDGKHVAVFVDGKAYAGTVREVRQDLTSDEQDQDGVRDIDVCFRKRSRKRARKG